MSFANSNHTLADHYSRMLLWHGSRLSNWIGILTQGLRIAPPEAPVTGYMVRNLQRFIYDPYRFTIQTRTKHAI